MWKFILAFIVVFCAGLIIRELMRPKTSGSPEQSGVYNASPSNARFCPDCGTQADAADNFCRKCGRKLN